MLAWICLIFDLSGHSARSVKPGMRWGKLDMNPRRPAIATAIAKMRAMIGHHRRFATFRMPVRGPGLDPLFTRATPPPQTRQGNLHERHFTTAPDEIVLTLARKELHDPRDFF